MVRSSCIYNPFITSNKQQHHRTKSIEVCHFANIGKKGNTCTCKPVVEQGTKLAIKFGNVHDVSSLELKKQPPNTSFIAFDHQVCTPRELKWKNDAQQRIMPVWIGPTPRGLEGKWQETCGKSLKCACVFVNFERIVMIAHGDSLSQSIWLFLLWTIYPWAVWMNCCCTNIGTRWTRTAGDCQSCTCAIVF